MPAPKIYTKKGDKGNTSLLDGPARKDQFVFTVLNSVDRLSVDLGRVQQHERDIRDLITELQQFFVVLGSVISTTDQKTVEALERAAKVEREAEVFIAQLEADIDYRTEKLPQLRNFLLPQGKPAALDAHSARVSCRQAESCFVALELTLPNAQALLNRLSDWLFTLARWHSEHELAFQEHRGTFSVQ
jgi:cob(I)alamin adenosyltransferase